MPAVLDSETSLSIGTIGLVPLALSMLAQAIPETSSDLVAYSNLTAVAVITLLFVWLLTKHIPAREQRSEQRQDERDRRAEERLDRIQMVFTETIQKQLEASKHNAASGHAALQSVIEKQAVIMASVDKNTDALRDVCRELQIEHKQ